MIQQFSCLYFNLFVKPSYFDFRDLIKTKTIKTPLVKAEAFGPTCCSSILGLKASLAQIARAPRFGSQTEPSSWKKHRYRSNTVQAASAGCF